MTGWPVCAHGVYVPPADADHTLWPRCTACELTTRVAELEQENRRMRALLESVGLRCE